MSAVTTGHIAIPLDRASIGRFVTGMLSASVGRILWAGVQRMLSASVERDTTNRRDLLGEGAIWANVAGERERELTHVGLDRRLSLVAGPV